MIYKLGEDELHRPPMVALKESPRKLSEHFCENESVYGFVPFTMVYIINFPLLLPICLLLLEILALIKINGKAGKLWSNVHYTLFDTSP